MELDTFWILLVCWPTNHLGGLGMVAVVTLRMLCLLCYFLFRGTRYCLGWLGICSATLIYDRAFCFLATVFSSFWIIYTSEVHLDGCSREHFFTPSSLTTNRNIAFIQLHLFCSGRAVAKAVTRRLPNAADRVRVLVKSCGICGWQSGTWTGFLQVLRSLLPILIPPIPLQSSSAAAASIIWDWYSRPNSGRGSKWNQSHTFVLR
jgi:hypothetical protein